MKRVNIPTEARLIIRGIQTELLWARLALCGYSRVKKAKVLARMIGDFSRLFEIDPRLPRHVPLPDGLPIPFIGKTLTQRNLSNYIASLDPSIK